MQEKIQKLINKYNSISGMITKLFCFSFAFPKVMIYFTFHRSNHTVYMPLKMFKQQDSPPLDKIGSVIAIAAGKGGVGKSTVTVNLALALKRAGYSVGIMDTDLYGPSIRRMLPEQTPPIQKGERIYPAICKGIRMISMAYFRKDDESTSVRAPIANGVISQFIKNVEWGALDFLLIDFPPGTGDIQLTLCQKANLTAAIVVTTPQEVAIMDVRRAIHLFDQVQIPILGVVENMAYYISPESQQKIFLFGNGGGKRLSEEIGAPLLGEVPIDPVLCDSGDRGISLYEEEKVNSSGASAFMEISKAFVAHLEAFKREDRKRLSSFDFSWREM